MCNSEKPDQALKVKCGDWTISNLFRNQQDLGLGTLQVGSWGIGSATTVMFAEVQHCNHRSSHPSNIQQTRPTRQHTKFPPILMLPQLPKQNTSYKSAVRKGGGHWPEKILT
jgi:hypothetical protein